MRYESELTHPPDVVIVDDVNGRWYFVYNGQEGFDPQTYAIKADSADSAEDVWCERPRNQHADTEQLRIDRLDRSR